MMSKLNEIEKVSDFFVKAEIWVLSTFSDQPNAAPIFFKKIDSDGNLVLFDVFMKKNLKNILQSGKAAVIAYNPRTLEGYQAKGTAIYSADEAVVREGNLYSGKMNLPTKGAVIVKVEEIFVQTPGPEVGKTL
jgi:predicted pyridoxine 5'-phosphate oxidase superfamily flavin-nucleotide-binding protein